ncbi:Scr1 family TA system antitoxin-like transcriptional regulator [Streptomyces bacillaris]|uniref:Scr1 family TA system antitoxin-like transcriptional regulator n=1 Tax=Streptomyces bacillaris TaxID=68179 RepID=UPI0038144859
MDTAPRPEPDEKARRRLVKRQQQTRTWVVPPLSAPQCRMREPGAMYEQLQTLQHAPEQRDVTVHLHAQNAPPHPLTRMPAPALYRVESREIADHVVREGSCPARRNCRKTRSR